ncbi:MAG: M20 family metallopeptidase [Synergistaceae bacterium]|jgi:succinyl-diaminopimelate desuccinylase|nr:M20 family metallopeptidase [Synergistaceae bacterium]
MGKYGKVLEALDVDGMLRFVQDLIRIDSVYNPEAQGANEARVTEFVADFLRQEGFEVHLDEVAPGRANVVAFLRGESGGRTILLEGHQDVVSIGNRADWKHDPFGAEVVYRDGRRILYGRGSNDTKGNLGAAIFAAKAIQDSGVPFKGHVLLCIPVDEEGLMLGIKHFLKKGWGENVDGAIVCEPEEKQLCVFQKGAVRLQVTFRGVQCHGAMPLSGSDPNWGLARFITELRQLENFEKDRLGKHEFLGWPSFTPTVIRSPAMGVGQLNVVPGETALALDIRTVPGQDHAALTRQVRGIAERLSKQFPDGDDRFDATVEQLDDRPWTEVPKDHPLVRAAARAYREVMGREEVYNGVPGATDGTFLQAWGNIPVLVTGAGDRSIPHHIDEWVEVEDLIEAAKIFALASLYFLE